MSDTPKVRRIPAYRKDPHLIKAGIYVRVSTARVEQLRSLSNQVSAMTRYVYARENWVLKDIYLEVGSAKTGSSRREFTRLVDDCKKHQIETVVVKSLSRFGRDNLINDWGTITGLLETFNGDSGGYGLSSEALSSMAALHVQISTVEEKWQALKDNFAAGLGVATGQLLVNIEGSLDALNDYMNAGTPEEREEALTQLRANVEEFFTKVADIIREGIAILAAVGQELSESDDPTTALIGNILVSLTDALGWIVNNQDAVIGAIEAVFGVWLGAQVLAAAGKLGSILTMIEAIKAFNAGRVAQNAASAAASEAASAEAAKTAATEAAAASESAAASAQAAEAASNASAVSAQAAESASAQAAIHSGEATAFAEEAVLAWGEAATEAQLIANANAAAALSAGNAAAAWTEAAAAWSTLGSGGTGLLSLLLSGGAGVLLGSGAGQLLLGGGEGALLGSGGGQLLLPGVGETSGQLLLPGEGAAAAETGTALSSLFNTWWWPILKYASAIGLGLSIGLAPADSADDQWDSLYDSNGNVTEAGRANGLPETREEYQSWTEEQQQEYNNRQIAALREQRLAAKIGALQQYGYWKANTDYIGYSQDQIRDLVGQGFFPDEQELLDAVLDVVDEKGINILSATREEMEELVRTLFPEGVLAPEEPQETEEQEPLVQSTGTPRRRKNITGTASEESMQGRMPEEQEEERDENTENSYGLDNYIAGLLTSGIEGIESMEEEKLTALAQRISDLGMSTGWAMDFSTLDELYRELKVEERLRAQEQPREEETAAPISTAEPSELQKELAEGYWDYFRYHGGDGEGTMWNELLQYFEGQDDLTDRLEEVISQMTESDDWEQRENLPANWWLDAESWRSAGNSGGLTSSDLAGFRSLPDSIAAAAKAGTAQGVSGIKVVLDGYTVGQLVAPYVSESIARDVII